MPTRKWGSEKLVNTTTAGIQQNSAVAALGNGGFVVVWQDDGPADSAIRAQRYDALGNKDGAQMTLAYDVGNDRILPAVTSTADGGFQFAFTMRVGVDNYIMGGAYDVNGNFVGQRDIIFANGLDTNVQLSATADLVVAAWEDPDGALGDVNLRFFPTVGAPTGTINAAVTPSAQQIQPDVAIAPNGSEVIVTFKTGNDDIHLRSFNPSGSPISMQDLVIPNEFGSIRFNPHIEWIDDQRFALTWTEGTTYADGATQDILSGSIHARVFYAGMFPASQEILVNSTFWGDQLDAQVVALSDGKFAIFWTDQSNQGFDTSVSAIRMQVFDQIGTKVGGEIVVNTTTAGAQNQPAIAALEDGRIAVTYSNGGDISVQIIDPRDGGIFGGDGDDSMVGHDAVADEMNGGDGADLLRGLGGQDQLYGGGDNDDLYGGKDDDVAYGGGGADVLLGEAGDDELYGEEGNDDLRGGAGADNLDGGEDIDTANYTTSTTGVIAALDGSLAGTGDAAGDTYSSVEFIRGSNAASGNDTLRGNSGANSMFGNAGADNLDGMAGHDKLIGGTGTDTLAGGTGNDQFIYNALSELPDVLADFTSNAAGNNDVFLFKGSVFGGLPAGTILSTQFQSSTAATAANGSIRFFYETDTRILRFDADGSGGGSAPIVIATLQVGATMTFQDVMIF